ncbi:protein phosphatase CheZ [Oxalobacteraceae bacterium R-40]|uniref:Protein phosphatase CheZ n=2 Tax=Keguizhuia sedimenti TaxID=3064264 RepID=A0ABU1BS95_9BURK|nr:protein phosphatase CheZ [Oxalobacteraceae bacterium R-40]
MLDRIGHLTRSLHENLLALGLDGLINRVANDMPDARERLNYVAQMTEQAAQRVLNATDAALPLQQKIESDAAEIACEWNAALAAPFSEAAYRALAERTAAHLGDTRVAANETREHLLAIMMAQDFQDLTGQVIKKITSLAHEMEQQLVQLLVDYAPQQTPRESRDSGLLNGPQINPDGKADVVAVQQQVDDLLESLGF